MATSSTSLPAFVILPPNFPSIARSPDKAAVIASTTEISPTHANDLETNHWADVLNASNALRAWKGQQVDGNLHINRAPRADAKPEFEVYDDSYTETQESSTSIEREMVLKAFSESGIRSALSAGANGVSFGLGLEVSKQKENSETVAKKDKTITIHGFYNFPRVILYLEPETLQLSEACKTFLSKTKASTEKKKEEFLKKFFARFGDIIATKVTLGGRLCTTQEVNSADESKISEAKREVRKQLTATLTTPAAGLDLRGNRGKSVGTYERQISAEITTRTTIHTQGGNALLAASISDWTASVESYRYWRVIQQSQPEDILNFLTEVTKDTEYADRVRMLNTTRQSAIDRIVGQARSLSIEVDATYVKPTLIVSQLDSAEPQPPDAAEPQLIYARPRRLLKGPGGFLPGCAKCKFKMTLSQNDVIKRISVSPGREGADETEFIRSDFIRSGFKTILEWTSKLRSSSIGDGKGAPAFPPLDLKVVVELEDDCSFAAEVAQSGEDLRACRPSFQQDGRSVNLCWTVELNASPWVNSQELKLDRSPSIQRSSEKFRAEFISSDTSLVSNTTSRTSTQ
ncbi:membrane attack complex component perforin [Fusarium mundagurra]|uniref:Membrane attack complex component perforin n=1 Tax=Fusarium mundagurra TaxID=1567541 RepID=A0A8H6DPR6_9HYPO|nr:membrane attack complex component perforin [Fusarium mundagurra]